MSGRETQKRLASLSISCTIWWPFGGFCARPSWEVNQYRHNPDFSNWGQSPGLGDFPVFYVLRMSITGCSFPSSQEQGQRAQSSLGRSFWHAGKYRLVHGAQLFMLTCTCIEAFSGLYIWPFPSRAVVVHPCPLPPSTRGLFVLQGRYDKA